MARALVLFKTAAAVLAAVTLTAAANAGDASKGADVFKSMCATCHTIEKGAPNGALGPNLFGISGHSAAAAANFKYSPALKNSAIVWSDDKLTVWVQTPQKVVPGTKMILIHTPNATQAADVVAYVDSKK